MSVFLSVRTEQLGSHWRNLYEIWYLSILSIFVEKIQVFLKSDENNGYFIWRRMGIYNNKMLNSS